MFTATGAGNSDITEYSENFCNFLQVLTENTLEILLRGYRFPAVNVFYFVVGFSSKASVECKTLKRNGCHQTVTFFSGGLEIMKGHTKVFNVK